MSTQYRLVQSGKTASGGCSTGQVSSEPVAPRIFILYVYKIKGIKMFLSGSVETNQRCLSDFMVTFKSLRKNEKEE
jgi:hypothetical protein